MTFTVTNGDCEIGTVSVDAMSVSSVFVAGDLGRATLVSMFETPMEQPMFASVNGHDSG